LRNIFCCGIIEGMARHTSAAPDELTRLKLRHLSDLLGGQSEVARVLGVDRSRITRWLRDEGPDPQNQASLAALDFVVTRLRQFLSTSTAREWLLGFNAHLGNQRPIDLIANNRISEVLAAIEQTELGSYA
jgi:transcriptional regulator with XRE-family HTH domain